MKLSLSFGKRLMLFFCVTLFCLVIASAIVGFIRYKTGDQSVPMLRIAAVLQDLLLFILPAIVTALLVTRLPATFLAIDRKPKLNTTMLAIFTMIASIPAMDALIALNDSITFPESLSALETAMRKAEIAAQKDVNLMLSGDSIGSMVISVLIVGVLAGFSEELFFRGAFTRLLTTANVNRHLAIWTVAFIFSAMHMQFFGFFPRLLLGAFFGYMLCWSGSLWLPILLHALNNSIYVVGEWASEGSIQEMSACQDNAIIICVSIVFTALGLYLTRKSTLKKQPLLHKTKSL